MQRDTLNTFMCVHFTIIALKRIGVFHIQPRFLFCFFSPLIPFPAPSSRQRAIFTAKYFYGTQRFIVL